MGRIRENSGCFISRKGKHRNQMARKTLSFVNATMDSTDVGLEDISCSDLNLSASELNKSINIVSGLTVAESSRVDSPSVNTKFTNSFKVIDSSLDTELNQHDANNVTIDNLKSGCGADPCADMLKQFRNCPERIEHLIPGRRIVELGHLARQLSKCFNCERCLNIINTVEEKRYGLGSILCILCECGQVNRVDTNKRHRPDTSTRGPPVFDINTKAALGMIHSGVGATAVKNFMAAVEIPGLHHTSMNKRRSEFPGSSMWTLSSDEGRVDLQMDGGERQPVRGIREGKHLLEIDILLATWSIVTLSLRDYKTEGSSASPTGRRKFVFIWKGNFTPCEWPDKASIRDGMSSASESSEDQVIDNDEPFDAGVLVPGQEIYLKEQYLGTYPIHLKNLIPPKPEHRSRVLDMEHVSSLVASFRDQDIGQLVILIGLVAADRDPSTLDKAGAGSVECLGGNHTREALLTLFEEGTLRYSHVQVRLYRNLSREAALSIGYAHNMITHEKRKVVTFMDKVRLMRDLLPPSKEQSAENIRIWKSALALIFKKKDGRHVQRQFSHHLLMARLPDHVWEVLLHAVQGIQITERFFKPLMRLTDQYVEDALMTLRNGVPEYKQKVKRLLSDVSKLRNGKQKKAPVEDDVNDGFEERVDDMEEQIRQEINEEVEENLESDLVAVLKKEIADLRAANDLLQSENISLKTERCGLQKKLEEAASQAKKRKSTEVSCQKEKKAKQMFTVKQRVWAKYNDGVLYPAKIVEVMENGYKVRWVEDNVEGVLKEKEIKKYP